MRANETPSSRARDMLGPDDFSLDNHMAWDVTYTQRRMSGWKV
jgi:hypothetical protein